MGVGGWLSRSHVIQAPGGEGVGSSEKSEEVVRPKVVAHKTENSDPNIGLRAGRTYGQPSLMVDLTASLMVDLMAEVQ